MRVRHVIAAVLWASMALLVGYALMPQPLEIGLMLLRDRDYDGAAAAYASRWQAGDRDWTVTAGLAGALRGSGDTETAADVLQQFLALHPEHVLATRLLADIWHEAGESDRYARQLEVLARLQPQPALWRELAAQYNLLGDEAGRVRALEQVVHGGQAHDAEVQDLARWYAVHGRMGDAATVLRRQLKRAGRSAQPEAMELLTRLLMDLGQPEALQSELLPWLKSRNDLDLVARFAHLLSVRGHVELAQRAVAPFAAGMVDHPELLLTAVQVERASGRSKEALARLTGLMHKQRLPESAWEPLIDLALENGRLDLARLAVFSAPPDRLPDWVLAYFADRALQAGDRNSLHRLQQSHGEGFLENRPLLGAAWAMAEGDRTRALQWAQRAAAASDTEPRDLVTLASLFSKLGRPADAVQVLEKCSYGQLPEAAQVQLAWLYIDLNQVDRGLARVGSAENNPAWAILSTAGGFGDRVVNWVQTARPGSRLLLDLYYVSADGKRADVQWSLAREIRNRGMVEAVEIYPAALLRAAQEGVPVRAELEAYAKLRLRDNATPLAEREALVRGLLANKSFALALPVLSEWAHQRRGTWLYAYLEAAAQTDPAGLLRFLERELSRRDLKGADADQLLYALVEHGGPESALPHIRRFAQQRKGDWVGVYEWVLTLLKRDQELTALWKQQASDPTLKPDQRRDLAYRLIQAGESATAEQSFRALAASQPPESNDVQQLRFLWGPRPNATALDWLEQRANHSPRAQAITWVSYLLEAGEPGRALKAMSPWPNPKPELYLRALQASGQVNLLEREIEQRLLSERDPNRARRLARLALEESLPALADTGFRTVLAAHPGDREALAWHGRIAFATLSYRTARQSLAAAVEAGETDPEVLLLLGECVERDEGPGKALDLYRRGLQSVESRRTTTYEEHLLQAHLLSRAGHWAQGQKRWEQLLKENPGDRRVRADYAALLIHRGLLGEAQRVLSLEPRSQGVDAPAITAEVNWPGSLKFDFRQSERELVVRANSAVPDKLTEVLLHQLGESVEGVPAGYDSFLIRSRLPVRFGIQQMGAKLRISLKPQLQPRRRETDERLLIRRLEVLRAQLELARGELARSGRRYQGLLEETKKDPTLLLGMAMVQGQIGRWRRADRLYESVLSRDDGHAEAQKLQSDLWREQRDQVKLETKRRSLGKLWEDTVAQLAGHHLIGPSIRAGYSLEWNQSTITQYQTSDGVLSGFSGRRQRAELFLQRDADEGTRLRGQLFLGNSVGAGGDYFRPDDRGAVRVTGELRKPYWEFMEAVAQHGVRSRISAERLQRVGPMSAWITAAMNRYGLSGLSRAADTVSVSGGANYPLTRSRNPLFADYNFDSERARFVATRSGSGGQFTPLPFVNREIHAAGLRNAQRFGRSWRAEAAAGLAVDRLGGRAPYLAGRVVYERPSGLGLEAWFDRRLNRFNSVSHPSLQFGFSVTWRYGSSSSHSSSVKAGHP